MSVKPLRGIIKRGDTWTPPLKAIGLGKVIPCLGGKPGPGSGVGCRNVE